MLALSVHDQGYSSNVHDQGYYSNVHDQGYYSNVHDQGYSRHVHDQGYSRHASYALNLISMFLLVDWFVDQKYIKRSILQRHLFYFKSRVYLMQNLWCHCCRQVGYFLPVCSYATSIIMEH